MMAKGHEGNLPISEYEEHFWTKIDQASAGCWLWKAAKDRSGYGLFTVRRVMVKAHRFAYAVAIGPIPDGHVVRHLCNNPSCVRPSHLGVGTTQDNVNDRVRAGRSAKGEGSGARLHPETRARGDRNGARRYPERLARGTSNHKVTTSDDVVRAVLTERALGATLTALAIKHSVSIATVHRWVHSRTRKEASQ